MYGVQWKIDVLGTVETRCTGYSVHCTLVLFSRSMILLIDKAPNTCILYTIMSIEKKGGGGES